jgi:hypothetical protein
MPARSIEGQAVAQCLARNALDEKPMNHAVRCIGCEWRGVDLRSDYSLKQIRSYGGG